MFTRPLTNRIMAPLRVGVAWGLLLLGFGAILAHLGGAVFVAVNTVTNAFSDDTGLWGWRFVVAAIAIGAGVAIAGSTWVAAYTSGDRQQWVRWAVGSVAGALLLAVGFSLRWTGVLLGAAAVAWALAIPFDRWLRLGLRLVLPFALAVPISLLTHEGDWWITAIVVALSFPAAGLGVWAGDEVARRSLDRHASDETRTAA